MPRFETWADIAAEVRELVRLHQEYGDIGLSAMELIDDIGVYMETTNPECVDGRKAAQDSIGYLAGYEDEETRLLIFDLFECEHPIFGRERPSPEEAFLKGQELGIEWKRSSK